MKKAQLADGTILEFPPETEDAVIDRVVKEHVSGGKAEAPQVGQPAKAPGMAPLEMSAPEDSKPGMAQRLLGEKPLQGLRDQMLSRPTATMIGGTLGSILGVPGGPLGVVAGGGLGAAAGSAAYDAGKSIHGMVTGTPENIVGAKDQFKTMVNEAALDVVFGSLGAIAQPIRWGRSLLAKASGVTTEVSKTLQQMGNRVGVSLGAVDVGGVLPKAYAKTLGVFPWVGTPLRKGQVSKILATDRAINDVLNAFGPSHATSQAIGLDMVAAARGVHREFKSVSASLYNQFEEAVQTAARQDIIPTEATKKHLAELSDKVRRGAITLTSGEPLPPAAQQETLEYLAKLQELPELITPHQYRRLTAQEIPDLIGKHLRDGADIRELTKLKAALESDFSNIRIDLLPEGQGEAVSSALSTANTFYAKGIVQFQTKAGKVLERVDKNIFKAGKEAQGSLNADEVYNAAINLKSPNQIKDLTKLVGKDNMRAAASHNFSNAVEQATSSIELMGKEFKVVDPFKLEKGLGLSGVGRQKKAGIEELYKTAGVDLNDVESLLHVMKNIEGIGNPAEFVRRRAILSGVAGLSAAAGISAGAVAGGVPGGIVTAGGMTLLGRHFSKVFADPQKLKLMITALDESRDAVVRRAALGRLVKFFGDEGDKDTPQMQIPLENRLVP